MTRLDDPANLAEMAEALRRARKSATPCPPFGDRIVDLPTAYAVQSINIGHWEKRHRLVGHKAGFASRLSQRLAHLDAPLYGALFSDMAWADGDDVDYRQFCHPKVEPELALVVGRGVEEDPVTYADIARSIAFALPAIEIVDPRYRDWEMTPADAVADNTGAAGFVLGGAPRKLTSLDFQSLAAWLSVDGECASRSGEAIFVCHPLTIALWIARHLIASGRRLREGDVVLAGALGPPVPVEPGSRVSAFIDGIGGCGFQFAA